MLYTRVLSSGLIKFLWEVGFLIGYRLQKTLTEAHLDKLTFVWDNGEQLTLCLSGLVNPSHGCTALQGQKAVSAYCLLALHGSTAICNHQVVCARKQLRFARESSLCWRRCSTASYIGIAHGDDDARFRRSSSDDSHKRLNLWSGQDGRESIGILSHCKQCGRCWHRIQFIWCQGPPGRFVLIS